MRRFVILALLLAGAELILPLGTGGHGSQRLLTFGFLILGAYSVGELATGLGLPKIVGYLAAGTFFGSVTTGISMCGSELKIFNSTTFGSTMISRRSFGLFE